MSLNKLYKAVDKAPFAGKFLIRQSSVNYYVAGEKEKNWQFAKTALLLGGMALVHAQQAKLGISSFVPHIENALAKGESKDALYAGYDALYSGAMTAVAVRQAALLKQITGKHVEWARKPRSDEPSVERRPRRRLTPKMSAVLGAVAFTMGAQVGEAVSHFDSQTVKCEQQMDDYAASGKYGVMSQDQLDQWYEEYC